MKTDRVSPEYQAHKYCQSNKKRLLEKRQLCGCFYCTSIFYADEIDEFVDWMELDSDEIGFALCPHCGIDSVIGEYTGFPINKGFMNSMRAMWFEK